MSLPVEDYLHSLISLVNELVGLSLSRKLVRPPITGLQSRLAVNAVTLGNFEEPIKISIFVKELFAGFSMVGGIFNLLPLNTLMRIPCVTVES